ncbi:MAG: alpha/beta hydrolase family protein [Puniceicoccaceae bacterium]
MIHNFNELGVLDRFNIREVAELDTFTIEAGFLVFEDRNGRPCEVYAERCLLDGSDRPAVVHCVGGGQTVNRNDLLDWARKGFSSVSFDWQIGNYSNHDPEKKSRWPEGVVSQINYLRNEREAVLPLAVRAAGACIDWLLDSGRINPEGIGVTGISWGGYLAWLVSAYEPRVKAAVPVYGCGGQFDPRHPGQFRLHPDIAAIWRDKWDPFSIVDRYSKPVCYLSATNDFFGILPIANDLLNRLKVPCRRSWLPNCNHSISPGEDALGTAWLRHYLDGGPALPEEPALHPDGTIEADQSEEVLSTETWWTPALLDGDLGCWVRGHPGPGGTAAFGRVLYKDGFTMCTPLVFPSAEGETAPSNRQTVPSTYPDPVNGIGWNWGMGSTQFHTNWVRVETVAPGTTRLERDPGKDDDAPSFFLNQFAHPAWNTGRQEAVILDVRTDPPEMIEKTDVILSLRGNARVQEVRATLPLRDGKLELDLTTFPGLPELHTWRSVVRMEILMQTRAKAFFVGPLKRVND